MIIMKKILLAFIFMMSAGVSFGAQQKTTVEVFVDIFNLGGPALSNIMITSVVHKKFGSVQTVYYPIVGKNSDGTLFSKNGEQEMEESRRIAAVQEKFPGKSEEYISARLMTLIEGDAENGWKDAALYAGINPDELNSLSKNSDKFLEKAYLREKQLNINKSQVFINGKPFAGVLNFSNLYATLNEMLPENERNPLPKGYKQAVRVLPEFAVVTGMGMQSNDIVIRFVDRFYKGIKPKFLTYPSAEVSRDFPWLSTVPAYLIKADAGVKEVFKEIIANGTFKEGPAGYLVVNARQLGPYFSVERKQRPGVLELYVMSKCPYGLMAENALMSAMEKNNLPKGLKIEIHFIGETQRKDGKLLFSSLHGTAEWQEDARQLYISKHYPDKYLKYLAARNKNIDTDAWEKPAEEAGISVENVKNGFEEGKKLLEEDFKKTEALEITASPNFILYGQYFIGLNELLGMPGFEKIDMQGVPAGKC